MMVAPKALRRVINGILLLDKPSGCTSNAALQRAKKIFNARKAGHTGSLDPLASGMLPLCFGEATKVSAFLLDADKTYRVTARLGQRTDTADADGEVIEEVPVPCLQESDIRRVLDSFLGAGEQVPPMYSALKVKGRRLYEMARKGEHIERPARPIVIHSLNLLSFDADRLTCDVRCSKGTYIRSLMEDVAGRLGTLAHVEVLRRTGVGSFGELPMLDFETLERMANEGRQDEALLPVDSPLADWPRVDLDAASVEYLFQGRKVASPATAARGKVRVFGPRGEFVAIAKAEDGGILVPQRMFPALRLELGLPEGK
jgi:tRNA pseudouridine55 synthase